jgi:hypothetical protein
MNGPRVGVNLWNAAGIVAPGPEGRPLVAGCEYQTPAYINQTHPSVLSDYPFSLCTLPQKVRHAGFRLIIAGLEQTPAIESPTKFINSLPLS